MKRTILISLTVFAVGCGGSGGGSDRNNPVNPVNQAPTVEAEDRVSVSANSSNTTSLALSDDQSAPAALSVAATADNETLFPAGALQVTGTGATRSLELTPTVDEVGMSQVSVLVTDGGGLSTTTLIAVEVDPLARSASTFGREFTDIDELDEPTLINAIDFDNDAEDDDFADLLSP